MACTSGDVPSERWFCLRKSKKGGAPQCWKRPKNGTRGKAFPGDHRRHPCGLEASRAASGRSPARPAPRSPEHRCNKTPRPICSPTPGCRAAALLADFQSISTPLQAGEGKAKVPIYGFVWVFFLCFPKRSSLQLARKPGNPRGLHRHRERGHTARRLLNAKSCPTFFCTETGAACPRLFYISVTGLVSCTPSLPAPALAAQ